MIKSKADYEFYLKADYASLYKNTHPTFIDRMLNRIFEDENWEIWSYQKALRKAEYLNNCNHSIMGKIRYAFALKNLHKIGNKLGFYICLNTFGPGLSIGHPGMIIVNADSRIGANCHIHPGTVIGTQAGPVSKTPVLGDNIHIGPGVIIFDKIEISDNIAIGANSVVNKSFTESGITIAGVPAKKISDKGSKGLLVLGTEIAKEQMERKKTNMVQE